MSAARAAPAEMESSRNPRRVVALGGGTGLPAVLRGLRTVLPENGGASLTAVVTMTDDGGSSGRLRRSMGMPPPGDIRNCLVALAAEEDILARLFQHRYRNSPDLGGHTVGNLILAALAEQTGSFLEAVRISSRVLRTVGRILPSTLADVTLEAVVEDGERIRGETRIAACGRRIRSIALRPASPPPTPGVVEAILGADLVVLGPGSLYTSLVPNLCVPGVAQALISTSARVVLVGNLVSERGEAAGLDLADHVDVIERHAGGRFVDAVLVHDGAIDEATLDRYRAEGAVPLTWPSRGRTGIRVVTRDLLAAEAKLRHDASATGEGLLAAWRLLTGGGNERGKT